MNTLPLSGVRVVEIATSVAGPYASEILHGLGAEVLKIERPPVGDEARSWFPPALEDGTSVMFAVMNAGKEVAALNLADPAHHALALEAVDRADVLVTSLSDASLERLDFGLQRLRDRNPKLITASISAFGGVGPRSDEPGYDPLVQALSGLMSITGDGSGPPVRVGTSIVDMGTGLWLVIGILSALVRREQTGTGGDVRSSLLEVGMAWLPYQIAGYSATGEAPRPHGSGLPMLVPYQAFETADGHLMLAVGNDAMWSRLCVAMERADLAERQAWSHNEGRVNDRARVVEEVAKEFIQYDSAEWEERLRQVGVPCAPVQNVGASVEDPQVRSLGQLRPIPGYPDVEIPYQPVRLDGRRPGPRSGVSQIDSDRKER